MWVEIVDPQTRKPFYANIQTGECNWEEPSNDDDGEKVLKSHEIDWWELFDSKHRLNYYYNTKTGETAWNKPSSGNLVSLVVLQKLSGASGFPSFSTATSETIDKNINNQQQSESNSEMVYATTTSESAAITASTSSLSTDINRESDGKLKVFSSSQSVNNHDSNSPRLPLSQSPNSIASTQEVAIQPNTPNSQIQSLVVSESALQTPAARITHLDPSPITPKSLPVSLKSDITLFKLEGFAKKYFSTHKRGIFRRKVPVEEMIVFSKDAIPLPLLNLNKNIHKDALKNFKTLQKIMGDRSTKNKNNAEDIQELLLSGINHGEIRDEIYCQTIKQLTNNPKAESIVKGWELMSCLVVTFPPSKNFESYLENFIQFNTNSSDEKISTFAKHCIIKLERISKKGPRGKVPTIAEIDRAKESPFFPSVFGESLNDIMDIQEAKYPHLKLPMIMTFLAEAILKLNGCSTEGIFRVPGDADAVTELRLRIEKGYYDISGFTDASVPGSLFKFWLRDLTDPIVPADLYQYCITHAENAEKALQILDLIPEHNRNVLLYLISFLQIIADPKNQPVTRMSVNNIAMVFAPNILRCPSDNLQIILENTKYEQAFVRTLIVGLKSDAVHTMK